MFGSRSLTMVVFAAFCCLIGPSDHRPSPMIDLTYDFFEGTPTYPSHKKFERLNPRIINITKDIAYKTAEFITSEHAGTHMDSPDHFANGRLTIERIPIEHFEGPAVVVDISAKAATDTDALVTVEDIQAWEREHGRIANGSIVLMHSGWGRFWQNQTAYFGSDDVNELRFPGFNDSACDFLMNQRGVVGVGVDTASADRGISQDFPCHRRVSEADGFILENVANVDRLPASGAILRAFPMKIRGGTGAPTRIIATLPKPRTARSAS